MRVGTRLRMTACLLQTTVVGAYHKDRPMQNHPIELETWKVAVHEMQSPTHLQRLQYAHVWTIIVMC